MTEPPLPLRLGIAFDLFHFRITVLRKLRLTRCRIVPTWSVLKTVSLQDFEDGTMKLILPLMTLAGAATLLFGGFGTWTLSYL